MIMAMAHAGGSHLSWGMEKRDMTRPVDSDARKQRHTDISAGSEYQGHRSSTLYGDLGGGRSGD